MKMTSIVSSCFIDSYVVPLLKFLIIILTISENLAYDSIGTFFLGKNEPARLMVPQSEGLHLHGTDSSLDRDLYIGTSP